MYCHHCGSQNDPDAFFCKKCGRSLLEKVQTKEKNDVSYEKRKKPKIKTRTKVKTKTKVKKVKPKKNTKSQKEKVIVKKSSFMMKLLIFFLFLFIIILFGICGLLGYHLYSNENIEVPNVVSMEYEDAEDLLLSKELNISMEEKVVEDEAEVGIVLKQNQQEGKKVSKNTVIKVTVGVLDNTVKMIDVVGMDLDEAKNALHHLGISYQIIYEKSTDLKKDHIVSKQGIRKGTKMLKDQIVILTVFQYEEEEKEKEEEDMIEE